MSKISPPVSSSILQRAVQRLTPHEKVVLFAHSHGKVTWEALANVLHDPPSHFASREDELVEKLKSAAYNVATTRSASVRGESMRAKKMTNVKHVSIQWERSSIEVIRHSSSSFLYRPRFGMDVWNKQGYTTTLEGKKRNGKSGVSGWYRNPPCNGGCDSLLDFAPYNRTRHPNTVCLFHGTIGRFKDDLLDGIRWSDGVGALGPGFYMTTSPHVARAYACRQANIHGLKQNESLLLFEIHVTDAHSIRRVKFESAEVLRPNAKTSTFVVNVLPDYDGQVAVRGRAVSHCHVRNVHVIDASLLRKTRIPNTSDSAMEECFDPPPTSPRKRPSSPRRRTTS